MRKYILIKIIVMKSIDKLKKIVKKEQRVEKKILLKNGQISCVRNLFLEKGFKKIYEIRKISSIYFDDIDLNCLRDNIDGNKDRYKIRIRWYNDNIKNSNIEIKFKEGYVGYKKRYEIKNKIHDIKDLISFTKKWILENFGIYMNPVINISYIREYYSNKKLRLTIDTKLKAIKYIGSSISTTGLFNNEVIEFKYDLEQDNYFRNFYKYIQKFNLRVSKSSKYSLGMMY